MGFWGAAEEALVNGTAGAAGLAEIVPVVGLAANAVASGIHGADSAIHSGISMYDSWTGDNEGAAHHAHIASAQGADAIAAAIPYVGVAAAAGDLVNAGGNAVQAGRRAAGASDEEAPLMPSLGHKAVEWSGRGGAIDRRAGVGGHGGGGH